ncbi:MAG: hypothetical protein K5838_08925 [Elusimicrobiales bacterium]|nr:hypothetical protein [Elusimicrobiales bacterium]
MEEVLSHISENPQPQKSRPIWEYARDGINGFMARWADHLRPLESITEEAEKRGGITLPQNRNPYFLARLFPGRLGRARQMLEDGVYLFTGENRTRQKASESLKKILNDMEAAGGNQREFNAYLAAERAIELNDIKTHSEFKGNIKKELEDARDSLSRTVPTMPGGFTPTPENETIKITKAAKPKNAPTEAESQIKYFATAAKGDYIIPNTGAKVHFGRDAIRRGYSKKAENIDSLKLFYNLKAALKEAKYIECEKNDGQPKHADVIRQDIYLSSAEIDGKTYIFEIKVDYVKNDNGERFYRYADHKTIKKEESVLCGSMSAGGFPLSISIADAKKAVNKTIKRGRSAVADLTPPESLPNISIADAKKAVNSRIEHYLKLEAEHKKLEKQLAEQGYIVETGIPLEDARKTAAALRRKYKRHAHKLYHYCAAVLAYYRDAGLMSQEAYSKIRSRHKKYVPFYREFEEERPYMMGGATMTARQTVHAIKGSTRDIINPTDNIIKQTIDIVDAAERNRVNLALADLAEIPGTLPDMASIFRLFRKALMSWLSLKSLITSSLNASLNSGSFFRRFAMPVSKSSSDMTKSAGSAPSFLISSSGNFTMPLFIPFSLLQRSCECLCQAGRLFCAQSQSWGCLSCSMPCKR